MHVLKTAFPVLQIPSGTGLLEKNTDFGLFIWKLCNSSLKISSPVGEQGATFSNIIYGIITIWRTEGVITWPLPWKFAHLNEFSLPDHNLVITWNIRSFVWLFNPLFWLYGLPLISYSVTVWFPLKGNSPIPNFPSVMPAKNAETNSTEEAVWSGSSLSAILKITLWLQLWQSTFLLRAFQKVFNTLQCLPQLFCDLLIIWVNSLDPDQDW